MALVFVFFVFCLFSMTIQVTISIPDLVQVGQVLCLSTSLLLVSTQELMQFQSKTPQDCATYSQVQQEQALMFIFDMCLKSLQVFPTQFYINLKCCKHQTFLMRY
jgi:hypothetical protein